jgi:hypothetical protein
MRFVKRFPVSRRLCLFTRIPQQFHYSKSKEEDPSNLSFFGQWKRELNNSLKDTEWNQVQKDLDENTTMKGIQYTSDTVKTVAGKTVDLSAKGIEGVFVAGDKIFETTAAKKIVETVDKVTEVISETKVIKTIVEETIQKKQHLYMNEMYAFRSEHQRVEDKKNIPISDVVEDTTTTTVIPFKKQEGSKLKQALQTTLETLNESRNPLVQGLNLFVKAAHKTVGFVEDSVFRSTSKGEILTLIKERDPTFDLDKFMYQVEHFLMPTILNAYFKDDTATLAKYASTKCFKGYLLPRIQQRKGTKYDTRVLDIQDVTLMNVTVVGEDPVLVIGGTYQFIHCIRDKKGDIVEGAIDDIRLENHLWVLSMDPSHESNDWEIQELGFGGSIRII